MKHIVKTFAFVLAIQISHQVAVGSDLRSRPLVKEILDGSSSPSSTPPLSAARFDEIYRSRYLGEIRASSNPGKSQQSGLLKGTRSLDAGWLTASGGFWCIAGFTVNPVTGSVFAATSGVLRSRNHQDSWVSVNSGITNGYTTSIVATSQGHIFIGARGGNIFRSTDDGESWFDVSSGMPHDYDTVWVWDLAADAQGRIFALTNLGVYRSDDGGGSWTMTLENHYHGSYTHGIVVTPNGHVFVYVNGSINRSTDLGLTWEQVHTGIIRTLLSTATGAILAGGNYGVYRSTDDGTTWTEFTNGFYAGGVNVMALASGPGGEIFASASLGGIFRSTDTGESWSLTFYAPAFWDQNYFDPRSLFVDPDGNILAGYGDSYGIVRSSDNGTSWHQSKMNVANGSIFAIAATPTGRILAGGLHGLFSSDDNGENWNMSFPVGRGGVTGFAVQPNGDIFAAIPSYPVRGVLRSTDNGDSWENVGATLPNKSVWSVAVSWNGDVYAATMAETPATLYRSTDNGTTWTTQSSNFTVNGVCTILTTASGTMFIGTNTDGKILRSNDFGITWTELASFRDVVSSGSSSELPPPPPGQGGRDVQTLYGTSSGTLFAGVFGKGIYRSMDDGTTWTLASTGLTSSGVMSITGDQNGTIFAGTSDKGVFRSTDNGAHWVDANQGSFANQTILTLAASPEGRIYVGTNGRGIYQNPSLSSLPHMIFPGDNITQPQHSMRLLSAGSSDIGCTSGSTIVVKNTGQLTMQISNAKATDAAFIITPTAATIAPGETGEFNVTFAPTAYGEQSANVVFVYNAPQPFEAVRVTGVSARFDYGYSAQVVADEGWQLLSLPVKRLCPQPFQQVFSFDRTYVPTHELVNGRGYWSRQYDQTTYPFDGYPVDAETVDVNEGWNLIGSISDPVSVTDITSDPPGLVTSEFFGYQSVYAIADKIYPGHAYWMKAGQNGKLVISSSHSSAPSAVGATIKIIPTSELPPTPPGGLEIQDAKRIPTAYALLQNFPNPFNPVTKIVFELPIDATVSLAVFNVLGENVDGVLHDRFFESGVKEIEFDGSHLPSGVYFYRISASDVATGKVQFTSVKKMILIK